MDAEVKVCRPISLPAHLRLDAARLAVAENPANAVQPEQLAVLPTLVRDVLGPQHIALLASRFWGAGGVKLSVQFLDTSDAALKAKILHYANLWGESANVVFMETAGQGQIRVLRTPGQGYYSYVGTDNLSIPAGQNTMNLESFSLDTRESEYNRVVTHEFGHAAGAIHEQQRPEVVARIDPAKAIAYFQQADGWDEATTRQQVLTPLDARDLMAGPVEEQSIMMYQLPGGIMKDGKAIAGGTRITAADAAFMARCYPKAVAPPPPPPPPGPPASAHALTLTAPLPPGSWTLVGPRNAFLYAGRGVPAGTYHLRNDARDE